MCGIAGFYLHHDRAGSDLVRAMCEPIRHRGPDDEGVFVEGGCGLGMRRLSIIDLEGGHQPISNEDESAWIVFNGEIYNFEELTGFLKERGHRFRTRSDTEALVHLYEEEGPEGLHRLRGMFAFAIWDGRKRRLMLARDRFGKKPLYYTIQPGGLYFASEIKSLRAAGVPLEPDRDALRWYLQFGYIPEPLTAFQNVRKLAPAGWMTYSADGSHQSGRYWTLPEPASAPAPVSASEDELCERVKNVFDESVRIRMIADVSLGAFLSGGLDSSLVVASMARQSSEPVKTFSIGFAEERANELPWARMVAEHYRTEHHETVLQPDVVDLIHRVVWLLDEPLADTALIPTLLVSEVARQHVKVALTGDGGDELFGGYTSFLDMQRLAWADHVPQALRRAISSFASALPYSARGKNYLWMLGRPSPLERYMELNYAPSALRRQLFRPEWLIPSGEAALRAELPGLWLSNDAGGVSQAMYFETASNLTAGMLVKADRMSMGASLELRCPMLDHKLAELVIPLPHHLKLREGKGKYLLRRAMGDRLPAALLNRGKMGFAFPLDVWFRGPLRELLHDQLSGRSFRERGVASPDFVERMMLEHESGRRDNSAWLWTLLVLEMWFRQAESQPSPQALSGAWVH
jgi:asparagine synthase (glutamine-hydrolysing)